MYDQDNAAQGETTAQTDDNTLRSATGEKIGHVAPAGNSEFEQLFSQIIDQGAGRFANAMEVGAVASGAMLAAAQGINDPLKARELVASIFTGFGTETLSRVIASTAYNMGYGIDDLDSYIDGLGKVLKNNARVHLTTILNAVAEANSKAANAADEADENARAKTVSDDNNAAAQHAV